MHTINDRAVIRLLKNQSVILEMLRRMTEYPFYAQEAEDAIDYTRGLIEDIEARFNATSPIHEKK